MIRKALLPLAFSAALTGCNSIENQYVDATGRHGTGETTFDIRLHDGKFSISDNGVTCSGTFLSWQGASVVFAVNCTDGNSGTVTMTRPVAGVSTVAGDGTMQLKNGETRRFIFGPKYMMN